MRKKEMVLICANCGVPYKPFRKATGAMEKARKVCNYHNQILIKIPKTRQDKYLWNKLIANKSKKKTVKVKEKVKWKFRIYSPKDYVLAVLALFSLLFAAFAIFADQMMENQGPDILEATGFGPMVIMGMYLVAYIGYTYLIKGKVGVEDVKKK